MPDSNLNFLKHVLEQNMKQCSVFRLVSDQEARSVESNVKMSWSHSSSGRATASLGTLSLNPSTIKK
jgi:hypothetical protein